MVFIAQLKDREGPGSLGTLLDQSIPNIRHPLTALSLRPSVIADLASSRGREIHRIFLSRFVPFLLSLTIIFEIASGYTRDCSENWPSHTDMILDQNRIIRFFRIGTERYNVDTTFRSVYRETSRWYLYAKLN